MVRPFVFCLALCCSANTFASTWELFSTSTDGQKSFTDYARIKKDTYGLKTFTAWWQLKLPSAGTVNSKKFNSVLYLYRVDCNQASTAQLSANYYDASGKVIYVDGDERRPSVAVPDSTGEAFVEAICVAANSPGKPRAALSDPSVSTSETSLSNSVKTLSSVPANLQAPPVPEFADTAARLAYLQWLNEVGRKLEERQPHDQLRKEFLQTVWYESRRAGIEPGLILGTIETLSDFKKHNVLDDGARGYMAIQPGWTRKIGDGDAGKLFDAQTNLRFGCIVLRHFLDERHGDLKAALLDYVADSLNIVITDPRASPLADRIAWASEKWR